MNLSIRMKGSILKKFLKRKSLFLHLKKICRCKNYKLQCKAKEVFFIFMCVLVADPTVKCEKDKNKIY